MRYGGAGERIGAESMVDCWWSHVELEKDNNSWRGLLRVNKYLFVSLHGNYAQSATLQSPEWRELVPQKDLLIESCSAWSELQLCKLSSQTAEWFILLMIHGLRVSLLSMREMVSAL